METRKLNYALCGVIAATLAACGGGSSGMSSSAVTSGSTTSTTTSAQNASVPVMISDASADDWACIAVKVLSIALIPQGGGSNVTVYTAPADAPFVNLEQLDQLGEILGNAMVPTGTYTGAVITVSGNPQDIMLTASADPEAGFALAAGASVDDSNITVVNTQGSGSNLTVPVTVNFVSPLVVSTTATAALDLEFDLSHPAFIIAHNPPGATATQWAINFSGPIRHHPLADLRRLVLRHTYGTVTGVAAASITVDKDFPTLPAVSPETETSTTDALTINADATNGTLFYDLDAQSTSTIYNFSSETSLNGKYVRIAARYGVDGSLTATRIWASSTFNNVYLGPEGHVLDVNSTNNTITVTNDEGAPVSMAITSTTAFYYRQPWNPPADAMPISTGTALLSNQQFVRGFKVHASVNPLTVPMTAEEIDIETADYSGVISMSTANGFTYTHDYLRVIDDYTVPLGFIESSTANGNDPLSGDPILGYKWWNFAYPTLVTSGTNTSGDTAAMLFADATNGSASFGGTAAMIVPWGVSYVTWADAANPTGWSVKESILEPTPLPVATVASIPGPPTSGEETFTITAANGTTAVTVDASTVSGSGTLVYQVDRSNGVVTVSPIDITTTSGQTTFNAAMLVGTKVKVAGVPQSDGTVKAYVITYYTGTAPAM
jgi:Domain of unknown function (DUF4382)